jgi:phosphatidylserine/phosphatidylglycerophosphate/cardiolipin synthase-like enzyme
VIEAEPLNPGGQTALQIAKRVADFLGEARTSLDLALYDIRLPGEPGDLVAGALRDAAARGVAVRLAYNADHDERAFPPPPATKPELIESLPFPTAGIPGIPDLMHHKYVVRDGSAVWTGSTNWTTDSWTLQENVIVVVQSPELAATYTANFEELWRERDVDRSGHEEPRTLSIDGLPVRAWFTPGHGEELSHRIAHAIGRARTRVRIASPVLTAGPVIGTLAEVAAEGRVDLRGVVDRTQLLQVFQQWRDNGRSAWKIPILASVLEHADFRGKPSTTYAPDSPHDFMHAKVTVADDQVFVGSFNLSRAGERNAENVVEVEDAALADRMAAYIDDVRKRYERMSAPAGAQPT